MGQTVLNVHDIALVEMMTQDFMPPGVPTCSVKVMECLQESLIHFFDLLLCSSLLVIMRQLRLSWLFGASVGCS